MSTDVDEREVRLRRDGVGHGPASRDPGPCSYDRERSSSTTSWVYRAVAGLLIALAVLTGLTGARTPVIWFKICPVLLTTSAVLLLVASA